MLPAFFYSIHLLQFTLFAPDTRTFLQLPSFLTMPNLLSHRTLHCSVILPGKHFPQLSICLIFLPPSFHVVCSLTSFIYLHRCIFLARCSLTSLVKIAYHPFGHSSSAFPVGFLAYSVFWMLPPARMQASSGLSCFIHFHILTSVFSVPGIVPATETFFGICSMNEWYLLHRAVRIHLNPASTTYSLLLVFINQDLLDTAIPIYLYIVYGCLCTITAELSGLREAWKG